MGQALYRKHRPKTLDDVVGQEHITTTLGHALKSGRISHAYLFVGPRGVGKTSVARILAHEINGLPYTDDSLHFDIIEIDAASNRRIDEIRDLRDKVHIAPTSAKYKVYIIDEVHMLTKEAFNALLKTLEEPPAHVIFILATTEAHKLPETIISRTQRFTFKPADPQKLLAHLRTIAADEKIKVSDEALKLIAEHGDGSFRDSISLLDQASNQRGVVELADAEALLGIPSTDAIAAVAAALTNPQTTAASLMTLLADLSGRGFQAATIAKQLAAQLRGELLVGGSSIPLPHILALLAKLLEVPTASNPERYLEIILLQELPSITVATTMSEASPPPTHVSKKPKKTSASSSPEVPPAPEDSAEDEQMAASEPTVALSPGTAPIDSALWPQVLEALKQQYNTLYGIVRNAQVTFAEPAVLELTFAFAFHQKRIKDPKNTKILADIIYSLTGQVVELRCFHDKNSTPTPTTAAAASPAEQVSELSDGTLAAITNIFGGAELLES